LDPLNDELPPAAALSPATPTESFDYFDSSLWSREEHVLGRGWLLAENVTVSSSQLHLALFSGQYEGAEIASTARFGNGTFATSLRCGAPAGALCAFFLYQPGVGDRADEIDIEILGATREIWFTTWSRGKRTNHLSAVLGFDPAAGTHEYAIARSKSSVSFYVDGQQYASFRKKLPNARMVLLVNAWWPTWLTSANGGTGSLDVDWIDWS